MTTKTKTTWRTVRLGNVMTTPHPFLSKVKTSEYKKSGSIPIYDQGSLVTVGFTDDPKAKYRGSLPAILFGDHTLTLNLIEHPFAFGADGIQLLEPDTSLFDKTFFFYALKSLKIKSYGYERHLKYLREAEVPIGPIDEQKRIAEILSAFDEKIENNDRIIKTLEEMAQAIFKKRFAVPAETLSKGWEVKNVLEVVKRIPVGKKYENKSALPTGKVPILDQGQSGCIGYHNDEPGVVASVDEPVVIFTNHTCNYRLVTYPFSTIQNVLPYVGINGYPTLFVYYLTRGKITMQEYKGHWPDFEKQEFLVPPMALAKEFASFIKPMVQKMVETENENQKLAAMRDLLLPRLMSGEIQV